MSSSKPERKTNAQTSKPAAKQQRGAVWSFAHFFMDAAELIGYMLSPPKKRVPKLERKKRIFMFWGLCALIVAILIALVFGVVYAFTNKNAQSVYLNEKYIGTISDKKVTPENLTEAVLAKLKADLRTDIKLSGEITTKLVHAKKEDLVTTEYLTKLLCVEYDYTVAACVIKVDGREMAVVANQSVANTVFDNLKSRYKQADLNITRSEFVEDVKAETVYVKSSVIVEPDEAERILDVTTEAEKTYVVKSGDNLTKIAVNNGMTLENLLKVNPGVDIAIPLKIGQELTLIMPRPLVSVRTFETFTYLEVLKKQTETVQNDTKPRGSSQVLRQGKDGQQLVTSEIIRVNGFEEETKVISTETTIEPINEIIEIGTK